MGFKNRYLVVEIFFQSPQKATDVRLSRKVVSTAIKDSVLLHFGEYGLSSCLCSLQVKYVNPVTKLCIIRCSRMQYEKIWCAITFITSICSLPAFFNLLDLSGNIRSCRRVAQEYDNKKLSQLQLKMGEQFSGEQLELASSFLEKIPLLDG